MKFPPAATYRSRIAKDVASSDVVPNRIAPRLSTLTLRAANDSLPIVVYRMPQRSQFARARSQVHGSQLKAHAAAVWRHLMPARSLAQAAARRGADEVAANTRRAGLVCRLNCRSSAWCS